jgi:tartrate dehydrogenase/decarboxylase/D-malate dehydrogenase
VETESVLVDAMAAKFVLRPEDLSVVVASNLNANILSDRDSAPNIAGTGVCNPIGAIGSAAMMLDHLGLHDHAKRIHAAIEITTAAGIRTRDVGGTADTQTIIDNL